MKFWDWVSFWAVLVVAVVLFWTAAAYAAGADPKLNQILDPTVLLELDEGGKCSGELVYSGRDTKTGEVTTLVLTAKHCAQHSENLADVIVPHYDRTLRKVSYVGYKATVRGRSSSADIALYELQDRDTVFDNLVRLAPKDTTLEIGEPTWAVGFSLGLEKTVTEGLLGPLQTVGDNEWLRATSDIAPGNSGGGLYHKNDAGDFELIGVTVVSAGSASFVTGSVPISEIQKYLAVALPKSDVGIPSFGGPR